MDEYIKREATIRALLNDATEQVGYSREDAADCIRYMDAADVAPVRHGRWEQDVYGDWYCTNCEEVVAICESGKERTYRKPYCPNCGAKMGGGA